MSESQLFQFLRINAAHRSHRQMTLMVTWYTARLQAKSQLQSLQARSTQPSIPSGSGDE